MAAQKSLENTGMLAGVTDCGQSRRWGCTGKLVLGFKPRNGSRAGGLGPSSIGVLPFAMWLRKQERPCREGEGWKGLLLVGREKVPHGFGLRTGDRSGDTADGAGNRRAA